MNLTKEQVEQWCEDNNHLLIDKKNISNNVLTEDIVTRIAVKITKCDAEKLKTRYRGSREVFCRWLVWDYFDKASHYSLTNMGDIFNRDHSTVIHMKMNIDNASMFGWRRHNRIKFENDINEMHEKLDFKKAFK